MCDEKNETTLASAVPPVVKPFTVVRRKFPSTLTGIVDKLRRHKKRLAKRFSKTTSPPNPPIV